MKTATIAAILSLTFALHSFAYIRGKVTDKDAVAHAQVIVIGRLRSSSLAMGSKNQYVTSATAILEVTEVLKAPFLIREIPIEFDHGLTPVVGGELRYVHPKTGVGFPDPEMKIGEIVLRDTGNSQITDAPITGDLNKDQIWLLRVRRDGKGDATRRLRVWDPEDIQPVSKKDDLWRLILKEKAAASEKAPRVDAAPPNEP